MDPATIALTATSLIATKIAEHVGDETGSGLTASFGRLYDAVRRRFASDVEITEALDRLEAKPDSKSRAAEVAEVLEPRLWQDSSFAAELEQLICAAEAAQGTTNIVTVVRDQASVGILTNIETVRGHVNIAPPGQS